MDSTPNLEANLNKPEVMVRYRGVCRRSYGNGKFSAEITDPKTHRRFWLGSFTCAIEAARAYDKAAIQLCGRLAILNFPLDALEPNQATLNFPLPESNTAVRHARKRRKHGGETLKTTERKPNAPVKLRSSPPSPPRQSPPRIGKRDNFKWTDESLVAMCDILNKHIATNGRNCGFRWTDHQLEFEKLIGHKFKSVIAIRSNHEAMRVRHNLWKSLKEGEIGLRWDEAAGKLDCSDDWWKSKVKENPDFKKFWRNQPSRKLQEAWDLLFDNVLSNGVPSVDPNKSKQVHYVELEDDDEVHVHEDDDAQVGNLKLEEATCFSNFVNKASQGDVCQSSQKIDKTREAESAAMHNKTMTGPNARQPSGLKTVETSGVKQVGDSSISTCMSVVNGMVDQGLMTSCSELWCFAVNLFEDDVKRELFMSLPDDVGRLAWLQFKQNLGY